MAAAALVWPAAYMTLGRRRCLSWGANADEVSRMMPGDELLTDPEALSTRAITIDASPAAIWPWLVQMGPGRGGAYTYDWIENLLGLDMHSADEILPQFQDLKVGDVWRLGALTKRAPGRRGRGILRHREPGARRRGEPAPRSTRSTCRASPVISPASARMRVWCETVG